jgi:hypothetical protein
MSGERFFQGTISKIKELLSFLSEEEIKSLEKVVKVHPMLITNYYHSLIDWKNPNDPIRKMIIPSREELIEDGSYDTSGEKENTILPGLQHKYKETALLLVTNRCASYCRYCFRKRLVGLKTNEILDRFNNAIKNGESVNWTVSYNGKDYNYGPYKWYYSDGANLSSRWNGASGTYRFSNDDGSWGANNGNIDGNGGPYEKWGHGNHNSSDRSCGAYYINGTSMNSNSIKNFMYFQ